MEATAELEPTRTHTAKHRAPGRKQRQAAWRAQQQQAAHTTPDRGRAGAESRRMRMEVEGDGGWGGPSREHCARSHPKH